MSIVVPNTSELTQLERIISQTLTVKLFSNNLTPDASTVLGDFIETAGC